jgi:hypothetical protein
MQFSAPPPPQIPSELDLIEPEQEEQLFIPDEGNEEAQEAVEEGPAPKPVKEVVFFYILILQVSFK